MNDTDQHEWEIICPNEKGHPQLTVFVNIRKCVMKSFLFFFFNLSIFEENLEI